jgi:hypothetical protein
MCRFARGHNSPSSIRSIRTRARQGLVHRIFECPITDRGFTRGIGSGCGRLQRGFGGGITEVCISLEYLELNLGGRLRDSTNFMRIRYFLVRLRVTSKW